MLKINNKSTSWRRSGGFIVDFKHISQLFLVFWLFTLNKLILAGLFCLCVKRKMLCNCLCSSSSFSSRFSATRVHVYYHSTYCHQTWQDGALLWAASTHNVTLPLGDVFCEIRWHTKNVVSPLPRYLQQPNLAGLRLTMMGSHP